MVSIIIPVYNAENYLKQCIESVVSQTYRKTEIILVDDGSTDTSGSICDGYARMDHRIKVIHQANSGVAVARNMGIRNAYGKYVVFADSDDWMEEGALEYLLSNMEGVDLVSATYWKNDEESQTFIENTIPSKVYEGEEALGYFKTHMMYGEDDQFQDSLASVWNKMFRADYLKELYETLNTRLRYEEDALLVYTYIMKCRSVRILEKPVYHYRTRSDSAVHSAYPFFLREVNEIYEYLYGLFSKEKLAMQLMVPLQRWITELVLYGLNEKMGFMEEAKPAIYAVPFYEYLYGKRVILYGAGKIGREYARSLKRENLKPVLWVDKAFGEAQKQELGVCSVDRIGETDYDFILLAVKEKSMSDSIRENLKAMGVPAEKILWKEPGVLYRPLSAKCEPHKTLE